MSKRREVSNLKAFLISSGIFGGATLGYFWSKAFMNRLKLKKKYEDDSFKDTTRPGNEYYGINWGFKADSMIKDRIDTGDLFFLKFECEDCTSLRDMMVCYKNDLLNTEADYDSLGVAFRDNEGVYIVFDLFGETKLMGYSNFLSQPYFRELSMRKMFMRKESKEVSKSIYKASKNFIYKHFGEDINEDRTLTVKAFKSPLDLVLAYFGGLDLLAFKKDEMPEDTTISTFDSDKPGVLTKDIFYDSKVVVRSRSNKFIDDKNY